MLFLDLQLQLPDRVRPALGGSNAGRSLIDYFACTISDHNIYFPKSSLNRTYTQGAMLNHISLNCVNNDFGYPLPVL